MKKYNNQHFISYGDKNFKKSVLRIEREAKDFNSFKSIEVFKNKDFYDKDFLKKYKKVIKQKKLSGYGIWKYYLINKKINEINNDEFLIYCDAGCTINLKGKDRYYEYLDMLSESDLGIISFPIRNHADEDYKDNPTLEKIWTTKEIFDYFKIGINDPIANSPQILSGILIIKKNNHIKEILSEYKKVLEYDQNLITDYYNLQNQYDFFKENRHDQSIWSVLRKVYGSYNLDVDESFFYYVKEEDKIDYDDPDKWKYPFWATRIKI